MTATPLAAVLWDMDGTLVDTEPYWMTAEGELIEEHGGSWSHDQAIQLVGQGLSFSAQVLQKHGVQLTEQEIIDTLTSRVIDQLSEFGVPWRPGARELLEDLRSQSIRTGLVTMSIGRMAHHVIDAIGFDAFDVVVAGDDVDNAKPHPEPYLRAADLLGIAITDAVALEDSVPGIRSAWASGATTIGVPFMVPLASESAHTLWDTLDGRTVADLVAVHTTAVRA